MIIQVVKPFMLQLDPVVRRTRDPMDSSKEIIETLPTEMKYFEVGIYEVEDSIAEHWYVKPHLKDYQAPPVTPGMAEFRFMQAQAKPEEDPSQMMPVGSTAPRRAGLPPNVVRAEPLE